MRVEAFIIARRYTYDGEAVYRAVAERQPDPPVAVVVPPRSTAVPSPDAATTPSQRDQHIQMIQAKGRLGWQKAVNYGRRSHAETAISAGASRLQSDKRSSSFRLTRADAGSFPWGRWVR